MIIISLPLTLKRVTSPSKLQEEITNTMLNILLVWSITNSDCSVVQPEDVLTPPMSGLNWQKISGNSVIHYHVVHIILFPVSKEDNICKNIVMDILGNQTLKQKI